MLNQVVSKTLTRPGDPIPLIPSIPDGLREGRQLGKLVPFVGAGASRLAGCPNWSEFAEGALRHFVGPGGKLSYAQLAQLGGLSPRVKLSLALSLERETRSEIAFRRLLQPPDLNAHSQGQRLYRALSQLAKTFVTTNYDEWLDDDLAPPPASVVEGGNTASDAGPKKRKVFWKREDLTAANLNQENVVVHLHGSVRDPREMVITTPDYMCHYANDRRRPEDPENPVLAFLEHLFRHKTVLFVGYGLEELEILEYVVLKSRELAQTGQPPRHFLLQGFFSHERDLMVGMRTYYRDCGVELLPFQRDERDWPQLIEVLERFARDLPATGLSVLQELTEMEDLLK
jgi:hypothetical protein